MHRADDAAVVDDAAHVGEAFTDIDATLAYLFESERRGHEAAAGTLLEQLAIGMLASMTGEAGLGSKVSMCEGPPFMKRKMTRLARAGRSFVMAPELSSPDMPTTPKPALMRRSMARRERGEAESRFMSSI